jgi:hypothetical protein
MQPRALLSSFALFLMGCVGIAADSQTFPSLARRPVETRDFDAEQRVADQKAVEQEAQAAADPALQGRIAKLDAEAISGASAFDAAYPTAGQEVAAAVNVSVSDDAYSVAQRAISRLEASRNQTVTALASLDSLYAERLAAIADGKAAGGAESIDAARSHALALVDNQNDRLDALKGRLPPP